MFLSFIMGFVAAIPVGASQIEIAKRSLQGYLFSSLMLVAGSVLSDTMYGFVAFFGIAPFLKETLVIAFFRMINAAILIVLGIYAIISGKKYHFKSKSEKNILKKANISFLLGFTLALTNPMMMLWWLIGSQFVISIGLNTDFSYLLNILLFIFSGAAGIGSYLITLSVGIYKTKKFFSDNYIQRIIISLCFARIILSIYFVIVSYKAVFDFIMS